MCDALPKRPLGREQRKHPYITQECVRVIESINDSIGKIFHQLRVFFLNTFLFQSWPIFVQDNLICDMRV